MYNPLFASLDETTTLITVTRRLSNYLSKQFDQYQKNNSQPTADIIPIGDWLKRCWSEYSPTESSFLLSAAQEYTLWQQIIRQSSVGSRLLQLHTTTQLAQQAWQLLKQWRLDLTATVFNQTEDALFWQQWAKAFNNYCMENNRIDSHSLPEKLLALIAAQKIKKTRKIILIGFDELNPQYQWFFKQLSNYGYSITLFEPVLHTPPVTGIPLKDTQAEIEHMARWIKQLLQTEPDKTIGCIVPNLPEIGTEINRIFTEVLAPLAYLPDQSDAVPFHLSAGIPLNHYSVIGSALTLLNLYKNIEFNTISYLLRSPYLGFAEQEISARARLEVLVRQQGELSFSLREIVVLAKKQHCEQLAKLITDYLAIAPDESTTLYPSAWAVLFQEQLGVWGWPGERVLNSHEYQLVERWQLLLTEFAQFDPLLHKIPLASALSHLQQIAGNTSYQPPGENKPIQILAPLEAAGLHFDYLWLMGLQENAWPPPVNPNPFLPIALQREFKLPHAISGQEIYFYQRITQQLMCCGAEIIMSYPQFDAERALRPSALITAITTFAPNSLHLPAYTSLAEKIWQDAVLESYVDHTAPALADIEKITGGSAILKYQALCPFRAFAECRLGAKPLPVPHAGLDARERGNILHGALEIIWRQLKGSSQLQALTEVALNALIQQSIEANLLNFIKQRPHVFKERFTQIEKARLHKIIYEWLKLEKQRPPFTVYAVEETYQTQINGIPLKIRLDRIDKLSDGNYMIIDYKTGLPSINDWFSDRPVDPQLPLYISTSQLPISSIAFGILRSNSVQFRGTSAYDENIPGIKPLEKLTTDLLCHDWPALTSHWRRVLTELARQFYNGQAHCDPKEGHKTCQRCDLPTLCRINDRN